VEDYNTASNTLAVLITNKLGMAALLYIKFFYFYYLFSIAIAALIHCKENPIHIFLFWELCGLSHNSTFMRL
jgi:hypothetical protein